MAAIVLNRDKGMRQMFTNAIKDDIASVHQ